MKVHAGSLLLIAIESKETRGRRQACAVHRNRNVKWLVTWDVRCDDKYDVIVRDKWHEIENRSSVVILISKLSKWKSEYKMFEETEKYISVHLFSGSV